MTQVRIGDREYTVGNLSTFKVLRAGTIVTQIMREVPELSDEIAEFSRKFSSENTTRISRAAAELRFDEESLARISPEGWEAGKGWIELPASPGPMEIAAFALPRAFDAAQDRVLDLLALLVTPNSELRTVADEEGGVESLLARKRAELIHEDAAEMLDLLGVAAEVIEQQFAGKVDRLRKVASLFGLRPPTEEEKATPPTSSPNGSTASPAATDGPATTGSGSASERSEVSSPS